MGPATENVDPSLDALIASLVLPMTSYKLASNKRPRLKSLPVTP
jgi:hypothetical protein